MLKRLSLINIAAILLPVIFAGVSILVAVDKVGPGFPLDDSWIHQTFARNFAQTGVWSYQAGSSAGGSTSPLWTMLLVPGYWIKNLQPYLGTYLLGILFFVVLVWVGLKSVEAIDTNTKNRNYLAWFWIFLATTAWQLIWAAGSGMETMIYSALVVTVFFFTISQGKGWIWIAGMLTGIGVWIRPDALTLIGPVGLVLLLHKGDLRAKLTGLGKYILAAAIPLAGYLAWNLFMSGEIFPNTFYAKQAEFAVLLDAPVLTRLFNVLSPLFAGVNVLLLPGILYAAWLSFHKRSYVLMSIFIWCLGYALIYALLLPVSYQHGRYLMPVLAPLILLGALGTYELISKLIENKSRISWVITRTWTISIVIVSVAFGFRGMGAYNEDVGAINQLMVASSKWVAANTLPTDIIAVHDIGAMGYFGQRQLIDIAGLVNPEIIPIIRNEGALGEYLNEKNAAYLVVLKSWYPLLEASGTEVAQFRYLSDKADETMLIRKLGK